MKKKNQNGMKTQCIKTCGSRKAGLRGKIIVLNPCIRKDESSNSGT